MQINIPALVFANTTRWQHMLVHPDLIRQVDRVVTRLWTPTTAVRYRAIESETNVKAVFIALAHERESSGNWNRSLAQGDLLTRRSVDVPAGRIPPPAQPPFTFEAAAIDALIACDHVNLWKDWSIGGLLTGLERWNGLGYAERGVPSPYIWAGSDQYRIGKFTDDHGYDPDAVDTQLGCAVMMARLLANNADLRDEFTLGLPADTQTHPAMPVAPAPALHDTAWVQDAMNRAAKTTTYRAAIVDALAAIDRRLPLAVDGDYGLATKQAVRGFQRAHGDLLDDGRCGRQTQIAIEQTVP